MIELIMVSFIFILMILATTAILAFCLAVTLFVLFVILLPTVVAYLLNLYWLIVIIVFALNVAMVGAYLKNQTKFNFDLDSDTL